MNLRDFLGELKRRRVFRVAVVYAIVAWILVQVAATAFPHLALPAWTITFVIVVTLAAFPIALILAWAFDLTPEGVKRDSRAGPAGRPADATGPMAEPAAEATGPAAAEAAGPAAGPAPGAAPPGHRRRWSWVTAAAVAGLLVAAAVGTWLLERSGYFWQNPLAGAEFMRLTDFEGADYDAAISRDGKFVAFLSDRNGTLDAWVGQAPTGEFYDLTRGRAPELGNPRVRNLVFSPDGSQLFVWVRTVNAGGARLAPAIWTVPTLGGTFRPYLAAAELDWSPDGTRIVYHTDAPGDPIFVTEPGERVGQEIYAARPGVHNHFPVWSPDGDFIYFVQGYPPDEMDIWRIRPGGGAPERITYHNSTVSHPTPLDGKTLLYLATAEDGSGPLIYGVNVDRRVPRRISFGLEQYTSLAAAGGGRRLVATVANPKASVWRIPISDRPADESAAVRIPLPTVRGFSPRVGPDYLLYLSTRGGPAGLWKLADGTATELWSGLGGRVAAAPAISPDGRRIAFPVARSGRTRLYVVSADGTGARPVAESLEARGAPAWSPDGQWIAVGGEQGDGTRLFRVPMVGGSPVSVVEEYSIDPVWSPGGRLLAYAGPDRGPTFPVRAVALDGEAHVWPEVTLPRGARRFAFLPGGEALIVLQGEVWHQNFWRIDLRTGDRRQLTEFEGRFKIGDFDVTPDGREIVFDRLEEASDIVLIDLPGD